MEMTRIDRSIELLNKLKDEPVGYHRFMLRYKKNSKEPICLVEGEDAKYYRIRIKTLCDGIEPVFIVCNGKKGVVNTHELIMNVTEYQNAKIFAFVDRDFDDSLKKEKIYETPCYSIENLYTTMGAYRSILEDEFKLNEMVDPDNYASCINLFICTHSSFHLAIQEYNAWIACQRELTRSGIPTKLNLNEKENVIMRSFFDISLGEVNKLYTIADIERLFPEAIAIPESRLNKKIKEFGSIEPQTYFRGKYELAFFKTFLRRLVNEVNKKNSTFFTKKIKVDFHLSDSNVLSELSHHAETPECLLNYIRRIWNYNNASVITL